MGSLCTQEVLGNCQASLKSGLCRSSSKLAVALASRQVEPVRHWLGSCSGPETRIQPRPRQSTLNDTRGLSTPVCRATALEPRKDAILQIIVSSSVCSVSILPIMYPNCRLVALDDCTHHNCTGSSQPSEVLPTIVPGSEIFCHGACRLTEVFELRVYGFLLLVS